MKQAHPCLRSLVIATLTPLCCLAKDFSPPTPEARIDAIGDLSDLDESLWPAFLELDDFAPIRIPEEDDWLAVHAERPQSFDQFLVDDMPTPSEQENALYIQPIGAIDPPSADLSLLQNYCHLFFNTDVKVLPPINPIPDSVRVRVNGFTQKDQLNAADILELLRETRPDDAFAVIAITMTDLYPEESWNFVFGLANYRKGVGVFSFARYGDPITESTRFQERALKVMSHEIGHMYGITHCVYFSCLMNSSNGLWETDAIPLSLCPVCLRKLHHSAQFDILKRYAQLNAFYAENGHAQAAAFTKSRIGHLLTLTSQVKPQPAAERSPR